MRGYGRFARGCAAFTLICGGIAVAGVVTQGCGGDDSNGASNSDSGNGISADGGVGIVAQNVSAYVGRVAQIDASQSTRPDGTPPLAFTWTLTGQPAGSKLSTSDIQGANTETPSITPDIAGAYTLHGEATTNGVTGTADVTVNGVNGDVYFVEVNGRQFPPTAQIETVQMDGTNRHALNCAREIFPLGDVKDGSTGSLPLEAGADAGFEALLLPAFVSIFLGPIVDVTLDTWESPTADQPSRVAFGDFVGALSNPDAGSIALVAATTDNTCIKPPHPLHAVAAQGSSPNVWQPRFSPDGSRIAYVEDRGAAGDGGVFGANNTYEYISTVGFDGSDAHTVASYCPVVTDACWGDHLFPRRPQWLDATHVAWIRSAAGANSAQHPISWEIVSASDADNGVPSRVMACTSYVVPYSFGFVSGPNLPPGAILANYQPTATAAEDLVILAPDPTGTCQVVTNLTNLPFGSKESYARDFAISPDGTTAAFLMHSQDRVDSGTTANPLQADAASLSLNFVTSGGGEIWTVPIDGSKPPAPLNANPRQAFYGPRFISGGTRLAWNGQGPLPPDIIAQIEAGLGPDSGFAKDDSGINNLVGGFFGGAPAMLVAPVAGGDVTVVASTDTDNGAFPLGGGNGGGCQCTPECVLQCPTQNCNNNVSGRHPELPLGTSAAIGALLVWRRRTRRSDKKKSRAQKDV